MRRHAWWRSAGRVSPCIMPAARFYTAPPLSKRPTAATDRNRRVGGGCTQEVAPPFQHLASWAAQGSRAGGCSGRPSTPLLLTWLRTAADDSQAHLQQRGDCVRLLVADDGKPGGKPVAKAVGDHLGKRRPAHGVLVAGGVQPPYAPAVAGQQLERGWAGHQHHVGAAHSERVGMVG